MALNDEQLMQRYQSDDGAAFDVLYARYRGPLYRYVRRQVGDLAVAEELYQDIWLRLIDRRDQWRAEGRFRPWLFGIAHHRLVDYWRRQGRSLEDPLDDPETVARDGPWPEALQMIRDCVQRLFHLLDHLAEAQRSAFLLKEEAGLSLQQIADVTGVPRETVKSRLRYAVRRLRQGLEDCND